MKSSGLADYGRNGIRTFVRWPGITLVMIVTLVLGMQTARAQSADCLRDVQGPDDEPGQKDLNQFCDSLGNNAPYELTVTWDLDDTAWSGSNTGDACALFDTDGDHNANFALCVTVTGGPPAVIKAGSPKLYSCADSRPDRCVGSVAISSFASTCSVGQGADPFSRSGNVCKNSPGCRTTDTVVTCRLDSADIPGTESCINNRCSNIPSQFCLGDGDCIPITDVCSYPSEQPNSDPSDCVITPTGQDPCQGVSCSAFDTQCATASCNPQNGRCELFTPRASTTSCTGTSNGGPCDGSDHCSGTDGTCVDGFQPASTVCRASAGQCDVAERCTGTSGACPADGFQSGSTTCTGASNGGTCDGTDLCDGAGHCVDVYRPSATVCRASTGQCDVAENCTGASGACPANGFQSGSTACTGASNGGACDGTDLCDGAGHCVDVYRPSATVCRASTGQCDVAESCTGASGACPADGFQSGSTACTGTSNGGACDGTDLCDGAGHCVDVYRAATTVCRASAGQCDVAESCTGASGACPADGVQSSTTACTGASNGGACDGTDLCDGAGHCVDVYRPSATVCRASAGQCDVAENCSGTSGACPANGFQSSTTACTGASNGGACDGTDLCDGAGHCVDVYRPSATVCRASTGQCDVAESCTGASGACPANGFQSSTTTCTGASNGGACDGTDLCDGVGHCVDVYRAATSVCRASTGQCDVAENCSGTSGGCPADAFVPNGTVCDDHDACTTPDTCVGGSCLGGPAPNCDDANVCTTDSCDPATGCAHVHASDGTPCSDQNACTLDDVCVNGQCVGGNGPSSQPGCVLDTAGADDATGQKDLTEFCQNGSATCSGTILTWQWDDTGWSGSNTGDACALYDTDNDGFANYALCVSVGRTPAAQLSSSPRLYGCTDGKAFNCTGSTLITSRQSTCVVNALVADPFASASRGSNKCAGGSCLTADTQAQCCVKPVDFPYAAALIDVCSYPSQSPSSDPSECVKTVFCTNDNACVVNGSEGNCQGRCVSVGGVTQCVYAP